MFEPAPQINPHLTAAGHRRGRGLPQLQGAARLLREIVISARWPSGGREGPTTKFGETMRLATAGEVPCAFRPSF